MNAADAQPRESAAKASTWWAACTPKMDLADVTGAG